MWNKPLYNQERNISIIVLDTEVSQGQKKSGHDDVKIIALALLLSSLFIYNSNDDIDEKACSGLSIVTEFANFINQRSTKESEVQQYTSHPRFLWVLRDFEMEGAQFSDNMYFETKLSSLAKSKNLKCRKVRQSLLKNFDVKELITLESPFKD